MITRLIAFILVHFVSTKMLAKIERAIISEVIQRKQHDAHPVRRWFVSREIKKATRHLHQTLDAWKWEARCRQ